MLGRSGSFEEKQMASLVYWYGNSWGDLRFWYQELLVLVTSESQPCAVRIKHKMPSW